MIEQQENHPLIAARRLKRILKRNAVWALEHGDASEALSLMGSSHEAMAAHYAMLAEQCRKNSKPQPLAAY